MQYPPKGWKVLPVGVNDHADNFGHDLRKSHKVKNQEIRKPPQSFLFSVLVSSKIIKLQ